MIEHLSGKVLARLPHALILDVNGVGYGVEMPLSALCEAPAPGQALSLWIDTYVREDALRLFGFATFEDRQAFIMLRSVSGIGPKIALAVLSTIDAKSLRQLVLQNKVSLLESVPGIGRRTAEKLILELRPKMEKIGFAGSQKNTKAGLRQGADALAALHDIDGLEHDDAVQSIFADVRSALENLGYKEKDITPVMAGVQSGDFQDKIPDFQSVLKSALKSMRSNI
jgi:Holliday junction DNA helicase RuvA